MKISRRGIALIAEFEGFRSTAYEDIAVPGLWTIGYGFTRGVRPGHTMTREQADERLRAEIAEYEAGVMRACKVPPNQNQFDALCSFAWNVGVSGMAGSSVIRAHNRGDQQAAARAFALWNKAGGRVWPGLTRRRAAEAALYLEPIYAPSEGPVVDMPQAIDPERPMAASEINRAGVAAGGTAALAAVAEATRTVADVRWSLASLGEWLVPVLLIAVAGICGYVVWQRWRQRRDGWA